MGPYEKLLAQQPSKPAADPEETVRGCLGCLGWLALLAAAVAVFVAADWLVIVAGIASAIAWSKTSSKGGAVERAVHGLSEAWLIALSILAVLEVIVHFTSPYEAKPFFNAYERTVFDAARWFGRLDLRWGWLLVVLAILMAIATLGPSVRPVSAFLAARRLTGRVGGVLAVLSSFTFFAAAVAPSQGAVVLRHAQARFDRALAREEDAVRKTAVTRTLHAALESPREAARLFAWAESVGDALHMDENRDELVRSLVGSAGAPTPEEDPRHRLRLDEAADRLASQEARVGAATGEFDRGFQEILAKTADLPRKEVVSGVLGHLVQALGDHPSLVAQVSQALLGGVTKEALRDRTQPIVDRLVAGLRESFWRADPAAYAADLDARAEALKRTHAERAAAQMDRALALASQAESEVWGRHIADAKSDAGKAKEAGAAAQAEAVRAADLPWSGLGSLPFGLTSGSSQLADLSEKLQDLDRVLDRVREVEERVDREAQRVEEVREVRAP